ncbi:MAG: DUF5010 C-terminal domain-containing protein [Myxococcota bacterium]
MKPSLLPALAALAACGPERLSPDADTGDGDQLRPLVAADYDYPVYGIHFYGDDPPAEATIQNGQPMWSVELLYTQDWARSDWGRERAKLQSIRDKGFRVILRLDYDRTFTVPPNPDWNARWAYATTAGQIAATMADIVDVYVIGNEMTTQAPAEVRDPVWYACVYHGCAPDSAWEHIHANDATAQVLMGPLSPWPYHMDQIGMDNVDWLSTVMDHVEQGPAGPAIDGYALHAYSSTDQADDPGTPIEDPRTGDVTGMQAVRPFLERIYARHRASVPIHITESNTYWMASGFAADSYRDDWVKEAFQAVDEWNGSNDLKILSLDWYVYSHLGITDPASDIWGNAMMRTDNPRLNRAREDFSWVTSHADYRPGAPGGELRFQAENFTNDAAWSTKQGLEGVDFHDTDAANLGGQYRNGPGDAPQVDIARLPDWSGFAVGWIAPGEWLRYKMLAGGRMVRLAARYARGTPGSASLTLRVDGAAVTTLSLPDTGGWDAYTGTAASGAFWLPEGAHELRIETPTGGFNLDWFSLVPDGQCACGLVSGGNNFCSYPAGTPGCGMTQPGGYCTGAADWGRGWAEYAAACD